MEKLLITGGSGFIGTNLIEYVKHEYDILNVDIKRPKIESHLKYWLEIDINNFDGISSAVDAFKPELIIHLAARTDLEGRDINDYVSNTTGTANLLNIIRNCSSLKKIIFASSKFIAPNGYSVVNQFDTCPHTIYGKSKALMEQLIWENPPKCDWLIIRPTSHWGPYFGIPYRGFFEFISRGLYFHIGRKKCFKTYGFVGNTVYQICKLLDTDTEESSNKVYYLGDEPAYEIGDWANEIAREKGKELPHVPILLVKFAAYLGDLLGVFKIKFPMNSFRYSNMTTNGTNDLSEIAKVAPHPPYTRLEGTKMTVKWLTSLRRESRRQRLEPTSRWEK